MSYPSLSTLQHIAYLQSVQKNIYRYGGPILLGFGTFSSVFNLTVFLQKNLRKNSCSICLVAFNLSNFTIFYSTFLFNILQIGYDINLTARNLGFCRFYFYCVLLFGCLGPSYLLLASIDRTMITSRNARTRQWSTRRKTYICIAFVTVFWMAFHTHTFVYVGIVQYAPYYVLCGFPTAAYTSFISYLSLVIETFFYLALGLFGLWTIRNMQRPQLIVGQNAFLVANTAVTVNTRSSNAKERQLILICLTEVVIYFVFASPQALHLLYEQVTQNEMRDAEQNAADQVINSVLNFCVYIPYAVSFYTNVLISPTFRGEIKNLLRKTGVFFCCYQTRVEPTGR